MEKNTDKRQTRSAIALTAVILIIVGMMVAACEKAEQPTLEGKPIKRPVNIVR